MLHDKVVGQATIFYVFHFQALNFYYYTVRHLTRDNATIVLSLLLPWPKMFQIFGTLCYLWMALASSSVNYARSKLNVT